MRFDCFEIRMKIAYNSQWLVRRWLCCKHHLLFKLRDLLRLFRQYASQLVVNAVRYAGHIHDN